MPWARGIIAPVYFEHAKSRTNKKAGLRPRGGEGRRSREIRSSYATSEVSDTVAFTNSPFTKSVHWVETSDWAVL